eukprot:9500738-Pyramimonas_sp.AAC.1
MYGGFSVANFSARAKISWSVYCAKSAGKASEQCFTQSCPRTLPMSPLKVFAQSAQPCDPAAPFTLLNYVIAFSSCTKHANRALANWSPPLPSGNLAPRSKLKPFSLNMCRSRALINPLHPP